MLVYPAEAVGLVWENGDVVRLPNHTANPSRFYVPVDDVLAVVADRSEPFAGFYHSHPTTPAYPSSTDIEFLKLIAPIPMYILSVEDDVCRAFKWDNDDMVEVT